MSVVLSEHLPLLASAPDGIQKLRGLILELAVRGKLVSQDPNDEPASELLKRISKERARLETEGVCKKSKALPLVADDEQPFPLPMGWEWARLGIVSRNVQYGYTASADHTSKDVLFLRITDIQDDRVDWDSVPGCRIPEADVSGYQLQRGDIVIARTGGTIGKSYLVENLDRRAIFASYLIRVGYLNGTDARYTKVFLGSNCYWSQLYANSMGTGQPNVNGSALSALTFPLPPLPEQQRIVAKVDELMALCDLLEAEQVDAASAHARLVETLLGTLTQSTDAKDLAANWQRLAEHFDTLFSTEASIDALKQTVLQLAVMGKLVPQNARDEPASALLQRLPKPKKVLAPINEGEFLFEIPKNWQWARLGEVFVGGSGTTPARTRHDYFEAGTEYWVKTTDLNNALVTTCEEFITPQAVADCNLTYYPAGTVCIAMYGGAGTIGKTGVLGINSTINQSVFALPPVTGISPAFTHYYLKSIRGVWMRFAAGLRVAANINGQIIKNMAFPVPPVDEQTRIVTKVDELMAICDRLKVDLAAASQRQATLADTLIESALEAA